jgi:hypothetical protein
MFEFTGWKLDEHESWKEEDVLAYVHPKGVIHKHIKRRASLTFDYPTKHFKIKVEEEEEKWVGQRAGSHEALPIDLSPCEHPKPEKAAYRSAILRRFDFAHGLSRQSVICQNEIDNKYRVFVKGAPEKLA